VGWTAVEEYESDELADDSNDEKKLRSAERRALTKLRARKQNRSSAQNRKFSRLIFRRWEFFTSRYCSAISPTTASSAAISATVLSE